MVPPTKSINGTWVFPAQSSSITINGTIVSVVDGTTSPPNMTTGTLTNNIITWQGTLLNGNPTVLYNSITPFSLKNGTLFSKKNIIAPVKA